MQRLWPPAQADDAHSVKLEPSNSKLFAICGLALGSGRKTPSKTAAASEIARCQSVNLPADVTVDIP